MTDKLENETKVEEGSGVGQSKEKVEVSGIRGNRRAKELLILALLLAGNIALVWNYFSIPFNYVFSAPVVPVVASIFEKVGMDGDAAVRTVLLQFYVAGPLALYLFVREVTGRKETAILASVLYSLPIFRARFEALTIHGDGAHIAAMTFIPLAAFFLLRFLKKGSFTASILSSVMILLTALTSPFGLFVLMAVMTIVTFSEMLLGSGRLKFVRFLWTGMVAVGISAFWYNPEFVRLGLVSPSGRVVVAAVKNLIPLSLFVFPVLGSFGYLVFDRRPQLQPLFIALGLTVIFGLLSFAGGLARFAVSAQSRYYPELLMSIAFLWGLVGVFLYDLVGWLPQGKWFPVPKAKRQLVRKALLIGTIVLCIGAVFAFPFREMQYRRSGRVVGVSEDSELAWTQIRELTGGKARIIGYTISGLTAVTVVGILRWLRVQEKRGEV